LWKYEKPLKWCKKCGGWLVCLLCLSPLFSAAVRGRVVRRYLIEKAHVYVEDERGQKPKVQIWFWLQ